MNSNSFQFGKYYADFQLGVKCDDWIIVYKICMWSVCVKEIWYCNIVAWWLI